MTVSFAFVSSVSSAERDANAKVVSGLGLSLHRGTGPLAIVGGGPSINDHIDELRNWPGAIWAVNGTINWCLDQGLFDAYFYTIDAAPIENWVYDLSRIRRAVLAPDCSPSLFQRLKDIEVTLTELPDGGPTSAASADNLSLICGYHPITWFGCESSFGDTTHAFESFPIDQWVRIRVGGADYYTKPEFIEQAKIISEVVRTFPEHYSERSGGLLRAMVDHGPEYELIEISEGVRNILREVA